MPDDFSLQDHGNDDVSLAARRARAGPADWIDLTGDDALQAIDSFASEVPQRSSSESPNRPESLDHFDPELDQFELDLPDTRGKAAVLTVPQLERARRGHPGRFVAVACLFVAAIVAAIAVGRTAGVIARQRAMDSAGADAASAAQAPQPDTLAPAPALIAANPGGGVIVAPPFVAAVADERPTGIDGRTTTMPGDPSATAIDRPSRRLEDTLAVSRPVESTPLVDRDRRRRDPEPPPITPPPSARVAAPSNPVLPGADARALEAARPTVAVADDPPLRVNVDTPPSNREPVAAPAEPAAVVDNRAIEGVLERYRVALSTLDADAARTVWPTTDARALARAFDQLLSQELAFDGCEIGISGEQATANCQGRATYVPRVGSRTTRIEARRWRFGLRKSGNEWLIESVSAR